MELLQLDHSIFVQMELLALEYIGIMVLGSRNHHHKENNK
jgi:hypothetical protein